MQGKQIQSHPDATDWRAAIDAWNALRRYPNHAQRFALQRIAALLEAEGANRATPRRRKKGRV